MKRLTPNQHKRQRRLAMTLLPHIGIALHSATGQAAVLDMRTLTHRWLSRTDADCLLGLEHLWHIHTSVFLDVDGQHVTKTQEHVMTERYKQADLVEYLQDYHAGQLKTERAEHIFGYGWIATPHRRELTEARIDLIFRAAVAATEMMG